jgi:predicted MFS family arabinose efflux permease
VPPPRRPAGRATAALPLAVGVVLADSAIVTLALPDILREYGTSVGEVAWVLIAYNLALALAAVPAARWCARRDAALACAAGLVGLAAASAVGGLAPSLAVLLAARVGQALSGALVVVAALELLVRATGSERAGSGRWAAAGVVGAAVGPVVGGLLTQAISWQSIFLVQVPVVLLVVPAALALRGVAAGRLQPVPPDDRPLLAPNLALALLSAALTAALFLLVLLLVEGWRRSPAEAALTVSVVPVAALAARSVARAARSGTRAQAVAGSLLIAGGLTALALPPGASAAWMVAPQALIGLGLGLTVDALSSAAMQNRLPHAVHGGWTIAARHAGVVAGLAILTPIFTADLREAQAPAREAIAGLVVDAPLPASAKLDLAEALADRLTAERGRVPDLAPAFAELRLPAAQTVAADRLEPQLQGQLERAVSRAFRDAFLIAAALALLALVPAAALRPEPRP